MRPLFSLLVMMLIALSSSCGASAIPVPVVPRTCHLPPPPAFPRISPEKCLDGETELVCMTPADGAAIWAWVRDMARWSELATVCTDTADVPLPAKARSLPQSWRTIMAGMGHPRVNYTVAIDPDCSDNAFYHPDTHEIRVCADMVDNPAMPFFLAHEIAHAIIIQLDLPLTGSPEEAADELAAVALVLLDMRQPLEAARDHWQAHVREYIPGWASHPSNDQRYNLLRCVLLTTRPGPLDRTCHPTIGRGHFPTMARHWARLIQRT